MDQPPNHLGPVLANLVTTVRNPSIAHVRKSDQTIQSLEDHLRETATLCSLYSSTIGLPLCGRLLGLLHDIGKYSAEFQEYLKAITGLNGEEAKAAAESKVGKIDHATAGAQIIWDSYLNQTIPDFLSQVLCVVLMSHHSRSGMKDFLDLNGKSPFLHRLNLPESKTHKQESVTNADPELLVEICDLLKSPELATEFKSALALLIDSTNEIVPRQNAFSLITRHLFSCLLDADRINTSNFENPRSSDFRSIGRRPDWESLRDNLESHLATFPKELEIDQLRSQISDECRVAATQVNNLFMLPVPTGGGKTLASLRFALHRAASHNTHAVERIIYVLPYTSILDQNAQVARKILGDEVVLEHHSNLSEEKDTWRNRVLSENWDTPIVFTTSVQFLNALFAAGTKTARRMHQLSNAILIFDEIQSLPLKTTHLFNNAINFLCQQGSTTAVLCTATMPLLHTVNEKLGALSLPENPSIIKDKTALFKKLKRVTIIDQCRTSKWSYSEVAVYARDLQSEHQSLLIICNTKDAAQKLFSLIRSETTVPVIHLSTNMCPAHRRHKIDLINKKLSPDDPQPVICISTQLIEAGVDLDFGCVIRSLAGLDSIVQAAGRCNRHGHRKMGYVYVLNLKEEKLPAALKDIELAQRMTERVFHEFKNQPPAFDCDLLSEKAMNRFYEYYFYQRAEEMTYPCSAGKGHPPLAQTCTILSLLSVNEESISEASRVRNNDALKLKFRHAFSTAAQAFQVIDAPTQGIIVPYKKDGHRGPDIIGDLAACYTNDNVSLADQIRLHKQAQQYTVNVFPHMIRKLSESEALREVKQGEGVYYLDERYYHDDLGINLEELSMQHYLQV